MTYPDDENLVFDDSSLTALVARARQEGTIASDLDLTRTLQALFPHSRPQKVVSFSAVSEVEQRMLDQEKQLIIEAQNGSWQAFSALYKPCQAELFRRCVEMLGSREDAEEATVDAMRLSWTNLSKFHGLCRYKTWLLVIGYNQCIDRVRLKQRHFELSPLSLDRPMMDEEGGEMTLGDVVPDLKSLYEQEKTELREAFNVCWKQLTWEERCLLAGVYGGYVTFSDIGHRREASTEASAYQTGKYHVRKALYKLEALLRERSVPLVGSQALELLQDKTVEGEQYGLEGGNES